VRENVADLTESRSDDIFSLYRSSACVIDGKVAIKKKIRIQCVIYSNLIAALFTDHLLQEGTRPSYKICNNIDRNSGFRRICETFAI
jgi:hypothetical protein